MTKNNAASLNPLRNSDPTIMRNNRRCVNNALDRITRQIERQNQPLAKIGPSGASLTEVVLNHVHVPKLEQRNVLSLAMTEAE
ncbi:MAG: hypothetical protein ACYTGQ_17995 [Planctomycetota bacterium]|jgi:hypothetical protein